MALAEILNVFPIFMRRARIVRYLAVFVLMLALGKGFGQDCFLEKMVDKSIQRKDEMAAKSPDRLMPGFRECLI